MLGTRESFAVWFLAVFFSPLLVRQCSTRCRFSLQPLLSLGLRADNIRLLPWTYLDCTFLGPSRKRGPPKGYIDAIEARLHQTEALVGIMLAANDSRARSLLDDISQVALTMNLLPLSNWLF